jgi:hypothetical protein
MLYYDMGGEENLNGVVKLQEGSRSVRLEKIGGGINWMGFEEGVFKEGGRKTWVLAEFRARRAANRFLKTRLNNDG